MAGKLKLVYAFGPARLLRAGEVFGDDHLCLEAVQVGPPHNIFIGCVTKHSRWFISASTNSKWEQIACFDASICTGCRRNSASCGTSSGLDKECLLSVTGLVVGGEPGPLQYFPCLQTQVFYCCLRQRAKPSPNRNYQEICQTETVTMLHFARKVV